MLSHSEPKKIVALDVFLELRKTRVYVGRLGVLKKDNNHEYVFHYNNKYIYSKTAIPLGPDLPLTKKIHRSISLFKSLNDRIPSSKNPSYKEYCETMGINPKEKNQIVLLATIGRRGPSSFVFEPVYKSEYGSEDVKRFRKELGLTLREFALVFDFSTKTIQSIEADVKAGKDSLKRIAIYDQFPAVALFELTKRAGVLHENKKQDVLERLQKKIKDPAFSKNI
jgi:HipA-like protein